MALPESTAQTLKAVRALLLQLHKALLEAEKTTYEQIHGPIANKGEYFQLVVNHEWFSWLRPISQFIVQMDEVLMAREPQSEDTFSSLLAATQTLLYESDTSTALRQRYPTAIQLDPHIGILKAKIDELIEPSP